MKPIGFLLVLLIIPLASIWMETHASASAVPAASDPNMLVREKRYDQNNGDADEEPQDNDNDNYEYFKLKRIRKNNNIKGPILHTHKLDEDLASKMASDKLVGSHNNKHGSKEKLDEARQAKRNAMEKAINALLAH